MKKVWIIEVQNTNGEYHPLQGAGFPTKREAQEIKSAMQRRSVIERRQEFTRIVGVPVPRKTVSCFAIQCNYGQGWETECVETLWSECKARIKEYRDNSPYPVRWKSRRIKVADFKSGNF